MKNKTKFPDEKIKKDIEEIKSGMYPDDAKAVIGENRGQLFVRIPRRISKRLGLKKGNKIAFDIFNDKGEQKVKIAIEK